MENDFYAVYLEIPEYEWKLLLDNVIPGKGYSGLLWVDERDGRDCTILDETFNKAEQVLTIEHYYKGNQFNYSSPVWFLAAQSIRRHSLSILGNRILQGAFNRRTLIRADRLELLRYLVEESIQNPGKHFDPIFLGMQRHTTRWFYHPQRREHQAYLNLVLESLCETGDLQKKDGTFKVAPKALATLSQYENDERKHQDDMKTSRTGHWISGAILIVGLLAIVSRVLMWWYDHAA